MDNIDNYPKFLKKSISAKKYENPGMDLAILSGGEGGDRIFQNFFYTVL